MGKSKFNLEQKRKEMQDIEGNLENKKKELEQVSTQKETLNETRMEIEGLGELDEKIQENLKEGIRQQLESNKRRSQELNSEMGEHIKKLDEIKGELEDDMENAKTARGRLEKAQSVLEKVGLSGVIDSGLSELENHIGEGESFHNELLERIKEADDISKKLDMI